MFKRVVFDGSENRQYVFIIQDSCWNVSDDDNIYCNGYKSAKLAHAVYYSYFKKNLYAARRC